MLKLPAVYAGDSRLTFFKLKAKRERNRPFYSLDQNVLKYVSTGYFNIIKSVDCFSSKTSNLFNVVVFRN